MFAHLLRTSAIKPTNGLRNPLKIASAARSFATVEDNTVRQMPVTRPRATPVSYDRATFTIRVRFVVKTTIGQDEGFT